MVATTVGVRGVPKRESDSGKKAGGVRGKLKNKEGFIACHCLLSL